MYNPLPKHVELCLQGKPVGEIELNRSADSWHFGSFHPAGAFSEFATLFGEWSLLLHADEKEPTLSDAASNELRKLELAIDLLHAELRVPQTDQRVQIDHLNIDGDLVEIK